MLTASRAEGAGPVPADGDEGFTLLELMVVMLIMAVVLVIAGSALFSLGTTANRNESLVTEEQAASNAMAQVGRDIRSASAVTFSSSTTTAATQTELVLNENTASGSAETVTWLYTAGALPSLGCTSTMAPCLVREVGTQAEGPVVAHVANSSSSPIFSYFDGKSAADISTSTVSNIDLCTTAVTVDIYVSSPTPGVGTFESRQDIAITDQINDLTAPGNGFC